MKKLIFFSLMLNFSSCNKQNISRLTKENIQLKQRVDSLLVEINMTKDSVQVQKIIVNYQDRIIDSLNFVVNKNKKGVFPLSKNNN